MIWLSQRVIAYLQADTALVSLLGSADNIFVESAPLRKNKYVTVSAGIGKDQNNIEVDKGMLDITINVSRTIENAHSVCLGLVEAVNDRLNKSELGLTSGVYKVLHFLRTDDTDLKVDAKTEEYYFTLVFEFILDKS